MGMSMRVDEARVERRAEEPSGGGRVERGAKLNNSKMRGGQWQNRHTGDSRMWGTI